MKDWYAIRREHLLEQISILEKNMIEYKKKDVSNWDNYNKKRVLEVIQDTKNLIKEYREQLEIIDKAIKGKNLGK